MADKLLDEFMTEGEFAKTIGKTTRTLRDWRKKRAGPPFVKLGREILYHREAFVAYLKSHEVQPVRPRRAA
jgi:hypothetical protein